MHRLLVALLAALDAVLAAAGGIAVILAPLALLWVFGIGDPDWGALWPATASIWHLGHLVPVSITLPDAYLAETGIDPTFASFTVSLAPLAFAAFTALFAARSGARAAEAGAATTGWLSGSVVFAGISALVGLSANAGPVASEVWLAILLPSLLFFVPSFLGAFVGAWRVGDDGPVDALRARVGRLPHAWADVPALIARGLAFTTLALAAVGAVVVVAGLIARSAQVIGLYQASNADAIGATVIALGQLMYLPTLVVWAVAFTAGPGFALGTDTAVTPAATQVGALPGIPVLGAVPDSTSSWLLLLALLPVAVGVLTGWMLRSRMPRTTGPEPFGPRLVVTLAVAVLTGGAGALAALAASGSIGPGRLADTGPEPGPLALALGLEVLVGLAILLLSPRGGGDELSDERYDDASRSVDDSAFVSFGARSDVASWPATDRYPDEAPSASASAWGHLPGWAANDADDPADALSARTTPTGGPSTVSDPTGGGALGAPPKGSEPAGPDASTKKPKAPASPPTPPPSARSTTNTPPSKPDAGPDAVPDDDDVRARIRAAWAAAGDDGADDPDQRR
ncbi:cell division protein PerM [Microbacterium sp. 22296]|uniref:cell division protein PerM n=1 Tax=Microbacterium sp. 22296 TaxID=3453903 RepID=UPI003F84CD8C